MVLKSHLSSTPDYTIGFSDNFIQFLSRSETERTSSLLIPHLKPGTRVLDIGCGPGFIALRRLAGPVAPGEIYGIDMERSQIEYARRRAAELECDNAVFLVADAVDLPFEDGWFDVVHCSDILAYVPDTGSVLAEAKRVLKPGGILFSREMIVASSFLYPDNAVLDKGWDMFADLLNADDGHPQMGKEIHEHLQRCGFEDISLICTFETYSGPDRLNVFYDLIMKWFMSEEITEPMKKYGMATDDALAELSRAVEHWYSHPSAFAALAFGEALATRP